MPLVVLTILSIINCQNQATLGVSYSKFKMLHETGVVVVCVLELYVYKTLTLNALVIGEQNGPGRRGGGRREEASSHPSHQLYTRTGMIMHSKQTRRQCQEEKLHPNSGRLPGLAGKSSKARKPIGSGPQGLTTLILGHQSGRIPQKTAEKLSCLGLSRVPSRKADHCDKAFAPRAPTLPRKALAPCGG